MMFWRMEVFIIESMETFHSRASSFEPHLSMRLVEAGRPGHCGDLFSHHYIDRQLEGCRPRKPMA